MNLVKCPFCGKEIENDSFYCDQCGEELKACPAGHGFKKGKVCSECGTKLVEAKSGQESLVQPGASSQASVSPVKENVVIQNQDKEQLSVNEKTTREITGPSHLDGIELKARLDLKHGAIIGRTQGDYVHIFNSQGYISGIHAQINKVGNGKWEIIDKGSSNGTYLNNKKLTPDQPEEFKIGDVITFYNLRFNVI